MKKFFTLLFANILLIYIGCVPQLGRLYAYPIYRFFTGYGYENEWFCNPLWCFIAKWPLVFEHRLAFLASLITLGITSWLLPPVITVAFYFYCDWKNKLHGSAGCPLVNHLYLLRRNIGYPGVKYLVREKWL